MKSKWLDSFPVTQDPIYKPLFQEVYDQARLSLDPTTQVGALLINSDYKILVQACNAPPPSLTLPTCMNRQDRKKIFEHAERGVIYGAANKGISTKGLILITNWHPCMECSRAIVFSGIKKVVAHYQMMQHTPLECIEKFEKSRALLTQNHVSFELFDKDFPSLTLQFKNQRITFQKSTCL